MVDVPKRGIDRAALVPRRSGAIQAGMRLRAVIGARTAGALVLAATALLACRAEAGQYPAWGDTGWIYANKRECCNEAIAIAQERSAATCASVGGVPRPMRGGVQRRGFCSWETAEDDNGDIMFRCQAEASIPCR